MAYKKKIDLLVSSMNRDIIKKKLLKNKVSVWITILLLKKHAARQMIYFVNKNKKKCYTADDMLYIGIRMEAKSKPTPSASKTIIIGSIKLTNVSTAFETSLL